MKRYAAFLIVFLVTAFICELFALLLLDYFRADDNWFWKSSQLALSAAAGIVLSFLFKIWRASVFDGVQVLAVLTILVLPFANIVLIVLFLCFVRGVCL